MTTIINNFRIPEPACEAHSQACQYALIDDYKMKLLCYRCLNHYPLPSTQLYTKLMVLEDVREHISSIVSREQSKLIKCSMIDIHKLIQERKKQIEQKQYRVLEQIMKKLSQDKQKVYAELDVLEKYFQAQEVKYQFNIEQRDQIIRYLKQFCVDQELFRLKLTVSNQFGLNSFMAQVKALEMLGEEFKNRNNGLFLAEIEKQIRIKEDASFLSDIQKLLKKLTQQIIVTPLKLGIPSRQKCYNNQITERRNQSQQNIQVSTPRTSRQHSFAQLPRLAMD